MWVSDDRTLNLFVQQWRPAQSLLRLMAGTADGVKTRGGKREDGRVRRAARVADESENQVRSEHATEENESDMRRA